MIRFVQHQWLLLLIAIGYVGNSFAMTSNNPFDPLPLYSSANPHEFLYTVKKDEIRGFTPEYEQERANVTITPYGGRATDAVDREEHRVKLGDIHGPWNMIALTFNPCPGSSTLPPALIAAGDTAFCGTEPVITFSQALAVTNTQITLNTGPNFGRTSVDTDYRKVGVRFEVALMVLENFGAKLQGGFADLQQTRTSINDISGFGFVDQTTLPEACTPDSCCIAQNLINVNQVLTGTNAVKTIAEQINLDISTYHKTGIEDLRGTLFWRHAYPMNYDRDGWPRFLFIPFAQLIGTLALAPKVNPSQLLAVPIGNNGHDSVGFNFGMSIDFDETIELAIEAGGTFFSGEKISGYRMPSNEQQSTVFPCTTDVCIKPGHNWHFMGIVHARRFIDKLSALAQFAIISHNKDRISPMVSNAVFDENIHRLEDLTKWDLRLFNFALNYDISPHISIGALWQAKLGRRNAPRVNTVLGSFVANY